VRPVLVYVVAEVVARKTPSIYMSYPVALGGAFQTRPRAEEESWFTMRPVGVEGMEEGVEVGVVTGGVGLEGGGVGFDIGDIVPLTRGSG